LNQTTFLTQAQALLGKAISEHTTQRNAEVKSIINKDRQVAPKQMQLGARLAVNTHNMGRHFVESVKNARWSTRMSPCVKKCECLCVCVCVCVCKRERERESSRELRERTTHNGEVCVYK